MLGLAGYNVSKDAVGNKTSYLLNGDQKEYYNVLPLLLDHYKGYDFIPIYTELSKKAAKKILEQEGKTEFIEPLFSHQFATLVEDETNKNSYDKILKKIDTLLNSFSGEYEIVLDISHGLRHIPILMVINAIMFNIKNPDKIKEIIFAKEIKRNERYEIVDLKEYLELTNLSFVLANFKDNYTISSHIEFSKKEYKDLLGKINQFSSDVLSLSLEHLLSTSTQELLEAINRLLEKSDMFSADLHIIKEHIEATFHKREHRYLTYYYIAEDMLKKGYLVNVISLLFEGVGLYARRSFAMYDEKLSKHLDALEDDIKSQKKNKKIKDYYELSHSCRSYILYKKDNKDKHLKDFQDTIYKNLPNKKEFEWFIQKLGRVRNNLLHANSGQEISQIRTKVKHFLKEYEQFCIEQDILVHKPK